LHAGGVKIMHKVAGVRFARTTERLGCDAVCVVGFECGGHPGLDDVTTLVMVPLTVDAVQIPVVAGGGFADGRGLVAALALGACGIWVGTRFVASHEAFGHLNYKNKIVEIGEEDTVVSRAFTGKPCRVVRNKYADDWVGRDAELKPFPAQMLVDGEKLAAGLVQGNTEMGFLPAGQVSGLIHSVSSAGDVVRAFIEEAEEVLAQLAEAHLKVKAG